MRLPEHTPALGWVYPFATPMCPWPRPGPDDGHTWRLVVASRTSSKVHGEPHFHDVDHWDEIVLTTEVRAWSLAAALEAAKSLALPDWDGWPTKDE